VLDVEGAKLSKSDGSPSLGALRERGASAAQIRAALGFGGDDCGGLSVALS
jgi:glutamyl-Q tRNA(Asp) synthetase